MIAYFLIERLHSGHVQSRWIQSMELALEADPACLLSRKSPNDRCRNGGRFEHGQEHGIPTIRVSSRLAAREREVISGR